MKLTENQVKELSENLQVIAKNGSNIGIKGT